MSTVVPAKKVTGTTLADATRYEQTVQGRRLRFKGSKRSNDTHQSKTDPDSRLYRKENNTGSELRYIGHTLSPAQHGAGTASLRDWD